MGFYDPSINPEPGCESCGTSIEDMAASRKLAEAQAEVERLRERCGELAYTNARELIDARDERDRAQAEAQRLRKALALCQQTFRVKVGEDAEQHIALAQEVERLREIEAAVRAWMVTPGRKMTIEDIGREHRRLQRALTTAPTSTEACSKCGTAFVDADHDEETR